MPTFRVYLARPTTRELVWDWAQTTVAANADQALGYAYASWQDSHPDPPIPSLGQCRSMVNRVGGPALLGAGPLPPGQQAFMDGLQSKVAQFLSTRLDGPFETVIYPGGFNYGVTYGSNAYYNRATLQDVDALLGVSNDGHLSLTSAQSGGGFSALYVQILQGVSFSFSQADTALMDKQDNAASAQIASILTEFENAGGTYTSPLPFGGKPQDVLNQLTAIYGDLDVPPNLGKVVPASLRNAIITYRVLDGDASALRTRYVTAEKRRLAAIANATTPTRANGGQQVDETNWYVGYTPNKWPTANQLLGALSTDSNAVSVQMTLSSFSSSTSNLSVSGGASLRLPIADIFNLTMDTDASYDLSRYTSSSSNVSIEIRYPGVTTFAATPSPLSVDNKTGWYAGDILQEVKAKTGQDATGYKLQGGEFDPGDLFGPGKAFARLKTFVISRSPTVAMTFTGANASLVKSDLQVNARVRLSLFGFFSLGSASASYSVQTVDSDAASGSVTVTFGPPEVSGTTPLEKQVAYVMGGVASYPPDSAFAQQPVLAALPIAPLAEETLQAGRDFIRSASALLNVISDRVGALSNGA